MTLKKAPFCVSVIAVLVLSACAQEGGQRSETTRMDTAALYFHNDAIVEGSIDKQAVALQQMADDLARHSAVNGALIGAAMGCGLGVVSTGSARRCATQAAVGMAGGTMIGGISGKQNVGKRIEIVPVGDVGRSLRNAAAQHERLAGDLPRFLADQDSRLNTLSVQLARGEIDPGTHDRGVDAIQQERRALAEALTLTARDVRQAHKNLKIAAARGQTGLEWHMEKSGQLAQDVLSERAAISLL